MMCLWLLCAALVYADEQRHPITLGIGATIDTTPERIVQLTSSEPEVQRDAVLKSREVNADPQPSISSLIERLRDPDEAIREAAAEALRFMGPEVVPALRDVIEGEGLTAGRHDSGVRTQRIAAGILGALTSLSGARFDEAVEVATKTCRERRLHEVVRHHACQSLVHLGARREQTRRSVISVLVDVFQELDAEYLRSDLVFAFEALGPDPAIIRLLVRALRDDNVFIRRHAAWTLGRFGPAARDSLAALANVVLTDGDLETRRAAALAIEQVTPTP